MRARRGLEGSQEKLLPSQVFLITIHGAGPAEESGSGIINTKPNELPASKTRGQTIELVLEKEDRKLKAELVPMQFCTRTIAGLTTSPCPS